MSHTPVLRTLRSAVLLICALGVSTPAPAQQAVNEVVTVARGQSVVVNSPVPVQRVSIGDPEVADAVVVSPREVLVNARKLGSTTLILWDAAGNRRFYAIEVGANAPALQREVRTLFPGEAVTITASGNTVVVSGRLDNPALGARILDLVRGSGATVIDNLTLPPARQILLRVRFAEVTRTAGTEYGTDFRVGDTSPILSPLVPVPGDRVAESNLADGLVRLFLFEDNIQVEAVIRALRRRGTFRSLAEPNLLAIEGKEASFLAGGEFPFPIPQSESSNTITIVFKEFGIRLRFLPVVTAQGSIRLDVAPEVSSLDFTRGLRISGFDIPSLLTRRAETTVELRSGQTFAIAGLMNNVSERNTRRIPLLGDLPILGTFFRSVDANQARTELLVLVTPELVQPVDQAPPVPTGEPEDWNLNPHLRRPLPGMPAAPPRS